MAELPMISDHPTVEEIEVLLAEFHRQESRVTSGATIHKIKSVTFAASARLLKLQDMVERGLPEHQIVVQVKKVRSCLQDLKKYGFHLY